MPASRLLPTAYLLVAVLLAPLACAFDATSIKPVGLGLGGYSYWSSGPFADTMLTAGDWIEFGPSQWGSTVRYRNLDGTANPQFDANGYPRYLNPGMKLRTLVWPFGVGNGGLPAGWPDRGLTGVGKWVLTWTGDADLRLQTGSYIASESNGAATGSLVNGRRVYLVGSNPSGHLTVEAVNAANPVTSIKLWLPDPADPMNRSLESSGQFWHPGFLGYLAAIDFNHLRFMDWGSTNASPQQDWADRRRPAFRNQEGVLHRRLPAAGTDGDRSTGIAYEHMVALCNATGKDLWVCVPHLASDAYITNLANLIRFGSDGTNPYTAVQASPVHPPLAAGLRVWVEYSNEIWSNGYSFPQGNWANDQAAAAGLTKQQFVARRYAQVWRLFQQRFGGTDRLVRTAGIWTGMASYTNPMLTELRDYGATLSPAVAVDVIAPTTYFGNGIQDWAYEQANQNRGGAWQWFHTAADFTNGATRPVSVPLSDPYWTGSRLHGQQTATFAEWKKRIFSGSASAGGGPDSTGVGGGFAATLASDIQTIFGRRVPIVAYEGGPSLYTDYLDGGDDRDDGVTNFAVALNRRPEFAEIYRIQLNMARAKGLDCHSMFVDVGAWGKYGQWGHLEYQDQPLATAVKWSAVSDWRADMATIRPVAELLGTRPAFTTAAALPAGSRGSAYAQDLVASGGNVAVAPRLVVIGSLLAPGLSVAPVAGDPWRLRLSGRPQEGGMNYVYARVSDDDGDASWQIFSFYVSGGPGAVVETDFSGAFNGAASLPRTATRFLDPAVTWSGVNRGAAYTAGGGSATGTDGRGVNLFAGTDGIPFSVSQGDVTAAVSTLASAITDNEYVVGTVTPQAGQPLDLRGAEMRVSWVREQYMAPSHFAVFTSVGGFAAGQQIYTLSNTPSMSEPTEHVFNLPTTAAYNALTTAIQFRIYFYGSQYSHTAKLLGLRLARAVPLAPDLAPALANPHSPTPTVSGTAAAGQTVRVYVNGTFSGNATLVGTAWTYTPAALPQGTAVFTFTVQSPGGLESHPSPAATTTINPIANALPVITNADPATLGVLEDTAGSLALAATDADGDTLTWSVQTQGGLGTATASGTGTSRTVAYTPSANATGSDSFVIRVADGHGGTDTITVNLTITAVNDAPSFTTGANQTVLEDSGVRSVSGWATAISRGPANEAAQTLAFLATNTNNALFSVQPAVSAAGVLTFTPATNANGAATVSVRVTDNGGTSNGGSDASAIQTFTITVTAVNDAPIVAVTIPDQAAVVASAFSYVVPAATFTDAEADPLTWSATGLPAWLTFTAATRTFTGTPAAGDVGAATLSVTATDPSLATASTTFTLTVSASAGGGGGGSSGGSGGGGCGAGGLGGLLLACGLILLPLSGGRGSPPRR